MVTTFSKREWDVLRLICEGKTYKQMADILGIEKCTVSEYVGTLYEKLGAVSESNAVHLAYQKGMLQPLQPQGFQEESPSDKLSMSHGGRAVA